MPDRRNRNLAALALLLAGGMLLPSTGVAGRFNLFGGEFEYSLRAHGYATYNEVAEGSANPGNLLAGIPERHAVVELRPDLYFARDRFDLGLKPRFTGELTETTTALTEDEEESQTDAFVNEWRFRWLAWGEWVPSYGREVLLWGPAYSLNPSNPFYIDAGRTNPYQELGGRDFGSLSWLGPAGWTVSYIDNVGQGRHQLAPLETFHRTQAIKIDKSTFDTYGSLIYAQRNSAPDHLGFFFQATLSDAVLLYADTGFSLEKTQLTPVRDGSGNWRFEQPSERGLYGIGVLGLAYTFDFGPTINLEYLYNNQGWDDDQAEDFRRLLDDNAGALVAGGPPAGTAAPQLAMAFQPGSALRRRHYLFLQYLHTDLLEKLDFTWRITHNLEDHGTQWVANLDWKPSGHLRLFALGLVNSGPDDAETNLYLDKQWLMGASWSF